jgi:hypothetical protein
MSSPDDVASARAALPSADAARLLVLDAVARLAARGPLTLGDVVSGTGLAPHAAEPILSRLVREYACDLDVREDGTLVYRFDPALSAREDVVAADAARRRKAAVKRWLISFFKAWTVAMVIVYFVIYAIIVLSALMAASRGRNSNSNGSSSSSSLGRGLVLVLRAFLSAPWGYGGYGSWHGQRARRTFAREVERRLAAGEDPYHLGDEAIGDKPSLAERTWFHLFGAAGLAPNPLAREKELLTYLRAKRGLLTNADIIALLGVTWQEADRIGTRLVATYDGEMDLTDSGVAVYRFPNLAPAVAPEISQEAPSLGYLWQVRAREQRLRDHPTYAMPVLNVVNIVLGVGISAVMLPNLQGAGFWTHFWLSWFPLAFSFLFLLLGVRRAARDAFDRPRRERADKRIAIFRRLFTTRRPVVLPRDAAAIAEAGFGSWGAAELEADLAEIAGELGGKLETTSGGVALRVDPLWAELAEAERLRAAMTTSATPVGRTVFSTREGHTSAEADALSDAIAALERA